MSNLGDINDFKDMFTETVTLTEFAGTDSYGKPQGGTPASFSARIKDTNKLVRTGDGSMKVATAEVWIRGSPLVTPQMIITLPDGSTPPILQTQSIPDQRGSHHVKVMLG